LPRSDPREPSELPDARQVLEHSRTKDEQAISGERPPGYRVFAPYVLRHWRTLALAVVSTLGVAAADLAAPLPLKLIIDRVVEVKGAAPFRLTAGDLQVVALAGALVLAVSSVSAVASYYIASGLKRAGQHIVHDIRVALYERLLRLSMAFHDRRQSGDLVKAASGDVNAIGDLFSDSVAELISSTVFLVGVAVVALLIDPALALTALAVMIPLALFTVGFRSRIRVVSRQEREVDGQLASLATETLGAIRVVQTLGAERFESDRWAGHSRERGEAAIRGAREEARFGGTVNVLSALGTAAVLVLGVFRVASGALSAGDLVVMAAYVKRVHKPLQVISKQAGRIAKASARADRVAEILAADHVLEQRPGGYAGASGAGRVELRNVSFAYERERPVLEGVSLTIHAGERVALVGPSGAGKSTLAALVARLHDPVSGALLLDGRDLRDCELPWLRRQVGLLLQDTLLFTGTVAENIAHGLVATPEEIVAAARAAAAHDFITGLPHAYDTPVGPRGVALSGGQRQRIAIARLLLRDPAVLVLDEPTTGLDAASEQAVIAGLDGLMRGRTTIIITHSPTLAAAADRRIQVGSGGVAEEPRTERRRGAEDAAATSR